MDSLLDLDQSELESHLFSHLSELGKRDEEGSVETEEDVDIEEYQNKQEHTTKRAAGAKKAGKRSATKTGRLVGDIGSRGRPRKLHEPEPFLSINNVPRSKCQQLDPIDSVAARQVSFISNPNVPFNTPSRCSFRQAASRTSTAPTMSVGSTEWNSLVPKRHRGRTKDEVPAVNLMVQAPFKHSVNKTPRMRRAPSPSNVLRERTNLATYQVAKVIAKQKLPKQPLTGSGKLLKAKLKPMYPVSVDGPTIDKCRGILPEPKRVDVGDSHTVQRRRQIMYTLTQGLDSDRELIRERPHTVESVHQTSVVSDLSADRMLDLKEELEEVEQIRRERNLPMEGTPKIPPNSVASLNDTGSKVQSRENPDMHLPLTPLKSEATPYQHERSELESVSAVNTPLDSTRNRSVLESGPYSVGEVPEELRNDEGRKVRFADEGGSERSKSAVARLRTPTSDRKISSSEKADILVVETPPVPDETDEDKTTNSDDKQAENDENNKQNDDKNTAQSSADTTENANNNNELGDNTNNNNLECKQQVLKMKVKDMSKSFKKRAKSAPVRKTRPRSAQIRNKLGTWGDLMKPDDNIEELNICGKSTDCNNDMALIEYYGEKSATGSTFKPGRTCGRLARPLSAGPKGFQLEEKRRLMAKARPQSASVYLSQEHFTIESRGATMYDPDDNEVRTRFGVTNSSRAVITPVITYQNPTHFRRRSKRRQKQPSALHLSDLVQHGKARVCAKCGEGSFCYVDLEEAGVICEECALNFSSEDDGEEDSLSARAEYNGERSDASDDEIAGIEDFGKAQAERFENLENSLAQIQSEIGRCIENQSHSPYDTPRFLESVLSMDEQESEVKNQNGVLEAVDVIENAKKKQSSVRTGSGANLGGRLSEFLTNPEKYKEDRKQGKYHSLSHESLSGDRHRSDLDSAYDLEGERSRDRFALALIEEESTARTEAGNRSLEKEEERSSTVSQESTYPYAPLCFKVNARPPEGYCYYFAYGIDMNPHRFSTYIKRENVDRFWALLFGFQMKFNKKGEDDEAGCFPNIEYCENSSVEGAMYMIKEEEMTLIDQCMGFPTYVEKVVLPVWFMNCREPDEFGVAQYCVAATVYVARDQWVTQDCSKLANEYAVSQCIKSADLLSPAYKEYIISQVN